MGLSGVLDGITLIADVPAAHIENHRGSAAVLNCRVATELNKISIAESRGQMVASLRDLLHLVHDEVKFLTLRHR